MITFLAFLVAIGALVTFHELGHYWVARLCGVKVLRFSIGFGRPLFTWQRGETEWALCPIPLGGYVKMLDASEEPVTSEDLPRAFGSRPIWQRMLIVAAGPVANLLLAIVLYWVVLAQGVDLLRPVVGTVLSETPAAAAGFRPGDTIIRVGEVPVGSWQDIQGAFLDVPMDPETPLKITVRDQEGRQTSRTLLAARFPDAVQAGYRQGAVGLTPARYLPVVGMVEEEGAARRAGLRPGDRLLTLDGSPVSSWQAWVRTIQHNPGRLMRVEVERGGKRLALALRPHSQQTPDGLVGRIGAGPTADRAWIDSLRFRKEYSIGQAGQGAVERTADTAWMSLRFLGRMVTGQASLDNLSGPLTIASVAGQTARVGLIAYLEFLALISISIGVLNLLPIPVLDGGHLMYHTAELIKGRPLSERTQALGQRIGFALLASLMALAFINDLSRLFGG